MSYFGSSLLILFVVLITSVKSNTHTLAQRNNKEITDKLIESICHRTTNSTLCLKILRPLKGKSRIFPNSVAAVGRDAMGMALTQTRITRAIFWSHYNSTSATPENQRIRERYNKCFLLFSKDVTDQLTEANHHMLDGDATSVKTCFSIAVSRVNTCYRELMKPPREGSVAVLEAVGRFKDLASIIVAICNKTSGGWGCLSC